MKAQIEKTLSTVAGTLVEVTVRKANEFTFEFSGNSKNICDKIKNFFGRGSFEVEFDEELNTTFIYLTL